MWSAPGDILGLSRYTGPVGSGTLCLQMSGVRSARKVSDREVLGYPGFLAVMAGWLSRQVRVF